MRTIGLAAILALTSTAAFAGSFQFSVGGHNARIDFDENCTDRLCASVSWQDTDSGRRTRYRLPEVSTKTISKYIDVPKPHWNSPMDDDEDTAESSSSGPSAAKPSAKAASGARPTDSDTDVAPQAGQDDAPPPAQAASEPQAPPATSSSARFGQLAPRVKAPAAAASDPASETAAANQPAPANAPAAAPSPKSARSNASAPTPSAQSDAAPVETKVANIAAKAPPEAAAKPARPSPVGEWLVEDGEGKIRIEPCGDNLCGVVSAAKNPNETDRHNPNPALRKRPVLGTPILINMEPDGKRWSGRIYNVKDGRSYTAHISLSNANTLRVEGCAFGGMICGGQNWSRVN